MTRGELSLDKNYKDYVTFNLKKKFCIHKKFRSRLACVDCTGLSGTILYAQALNISETFPLQVFLKVCAAADAGHMIQPETLRQMDSQSEENRSSTDGEWKHDFEANGAKTVG
ncbi:hypothetical protein DPMN_036674 [Dreissena polymorpha]|uniref:Uncharacterized protein n=1 Tax=Dreissena polymorpha TaxID=45954 RepID=A0A9D4MBZ7_DREPO|nr:hypothetical protein DPMN_036674 [Dreissena polymorpha]